MYEYLLNNVIKILRQKNYSYTEIKELLNSIFNIISEPLGIGRIDLNIIFKENIYSKKSLIEKKQYNISEQYSNNKITINNKLSYGKCDIVIYPKTELSEEQKQAIDNIFYIICKTISNCKLKEMIEETPFYDQVTGALNTNGINREFKKLKEKGIEKEYSVIFFNIKKFKEVNKKLKGFDNGNIALISILNTISKYISNEEILGRLGGDNFLLYVKNENLTKTLEYLKRIELPVSIGKEIMIIPIECYIGYSKIDNNYKTSPQECANTAMSIAKKNNISIICYNDELDQKLKRRKRILAEFEKALETDNIVPFYQPKIDITTATLYGSESLVRWFLNSKEQLSPGEFIPILEEYNLIKELDFYMLEKVCKHISLQLQNGIQPVPVSVNFSRYNLLDEYFEQRIINIINKYNINHSLIEIEITESGLINNIERINYFVTKMHSEGFKISIDDYGTGYSSLKLLEKTNFDIVKMDKTFADDIGTQNGDIVFTHTIEMLKSLGKSTICEGIETQEQIEFLKNIGIKYVQGYYYDRPLPEQEYIKRLTKGNYYKK